MAPSLFTAGELVTSTTTLPAHMLVKELIEWFKANPGVEYAVIIDEIAVCGLVGRDSLFARIAGNKYGHAVLADKPITKVMLENPLIVESTLSISELVKHLFKNRGATHNFYEDIVIQERGTFLGLAAVRQLIFKQMMHIEEQVKAMEKHQALMAQRNHELMDTIFQLTKDRIRLENFFQHCSVPIVVLDLNGNVIQANSRFERLSAFQPDTILLQTSHTLFHHDAFVGVLTAHQNAKADFGTWTPSYTVSMIDATGTEQGVEISFNIDEQNGWIIVSVLRLVGADDAAVAEAIQRKVAQENNPLARSVAENLIDKEYNLDAAMVKLDALISLANKLDKRSLQGDAAPAPEPGRATPAATTATQNLSGSLGQFSIVDLFQLLVQGRKSGELRLTTPEEHTGLVYFDHGLIVHATILNYVGKSALRYLMTMETGNFVFSYDVVSPAKTIEGADPMGVLMEACAEHDEESVSDQVIG